MEPLYSSDPVAVQAFSLGMNVPIVPSRHDRDLSSAAVGDRFLSAVLDALETRAPALVAAQDAGRHSDGYGAVARPIPEVKRLSICRRGHRHRARSPRRVLRINH